MDDEHLETYIYQAYTRHNPILHEEIEKSFPIEKRACITDHKGNIKTIPYRTIPFPLEIALRSAKEHNNQETYNRLIQTYSKN